MSATETATQNITWLGHASIMLTGEKVIYIDPYQLEHGTYEPADIVLITHDHLDHCSLQDIHATLGPHTTIFASHGCEGKLPKGTHFVDERQVLVEQGVRIETVPAYNIGKAFHPRYRGGVGYIITLNGTRYYHAGDTDLIPEMRGIKADVAMLPIGGCYTMDPAEAARAADIIGPDVAIPIHYGSIVGSPQDAERFASLAKTHVEILSPRR